MSFPISDGGSSKGKPTPRKLPNSATPATRDFHKKAAEDEKDTIIDVAEQDPSTVLLHPTEVENPYYIGDIYDPQPLEIAKEWEIDASDSPYLLHVKSLSQGWPHLRWLSDFMEIGTTPLRWKFLKTKERERNERATRTKVTRLDFLQNGEISEPAEFSTTAELKAGLARRKNKNDDASPVQLQLYLVEDLSRDVIESLGSTFDIDPSFFREHVNDYAWYNVRDRFTDPPSLDIMAKQQNWFQIRWVRPRYFQDKASFEKARLQAGHFNVFRRPDDDMNNKGLLDHQEALVALTRTRASYWMSVHHGDEIPTGILLLDPTVTEGTPLWRGYRNWEWPPKMNDTSTSKAGPPNTSFFDDVVYWTRKTYSSAPLDLTNETIIPLQAFLHLVCAEWLTMISYLSTRLGQLEWEISFPQEFQLEEAADSSLKKLHVWRRLIPLYLEMLRETLDRVFSFPSSAPNSLTASILTLGPNNNAQASANKPAFYALQPSFAAALTKMDELQHRLGRVTSIATAAINIAESRLSYNENKNIARLSWLATIYIPLTFITGLFSIQPSIPELRHSFKYFFAVAIPLAVITIAIAVISRMKIWGQLGDKMSNKGKDKIRSQKFKFYGEDNKKKLR